MRACASCDTRVIPHTDGTCPSCGGSTDVKSEPKNTTATETPAKPTVGSGPMIGALIGVVVAAVVTNLSGGRRIDAMTIVTALGALVGGLVGVFAVRAVLAKRRRR